MSYFSECHATTKKTILRNTFSTVVFIYTTDYCESLLVSTVLSIHSKRYYYFYIYIFSYILLRSGAICWQYLYYTKKKNIKRECVTSGRRSMRVQCFGHVLLYIHFYYNIFNTMIEMKTYT